MAVAQHNRSRRALLGAALALPLLGGGRLAGKSDDEETPGPLHHASHGPPPRAGEDRMWRQALAAFEAVDGELRDFERRTSGAPWEEQTAVEEGYGERLDATYAALRRLLRRPAPSVQALLTKIVLVVDHDVATLSGGEACMAALKRDCRRLAAR